MLSENSPQTLNDICSQKSNENKIKKFLSNTDETSRNIFLYGCLRAIENNNPQYVDLILDYMDVKKIVFEGVDARAIYNCAIKFNQLELLDNLDKRLSVLENLKETRYVRLTLNGKVDYMGGVSISTAISSTPNKNKREDYIGNPLLFSLTNFNLEALEYILDKAKEIHLSVIENSFVETAISNNSNAILYLTEHKRTRKMIISSTLINIFLNEKTEFYELKQKALSSLAMMNLKDELEEKSVNNVVTPKLKV